MDTRQCIVCQIVKPLTEFYVSKHQAGGYRYECKACAKAHTIATRKVRIQRPTPALPAEKHCPRCHLTLPAEAFSVDLGNASGLRAYCKRCTSTLIRARQLRQPLLRTPPCEECLRLRHERGKTVEERPAVERFWTFVDTSAGPEACWPWTGGTQKGYGAFGVRKGLVVRAHRMAWELTHGPIPDGLNALHHCDNPLCCNAFHPEHLFLGTLSDNTRDMFAKERQGTSSFTPANIHFIREQHGVMSASALARLFGVDRSTIYNIWNGKTWTFVP